METKKHRKYLKKFMMKLFEVVVFIDRGRLNIKGLYNDTDNYIHIYTLIRVFYYKDTN